MTLQDYKRKVDHALANYHFAVKSLETEEKAFSQAKQRESDTLTAQSILQGIAEELQNSAHQQIASIVTRCLEAVFEDNTYQFKIVFESKRGKTEARLVFVRDGNEIDPVDSSGGGVIDVASFALRLACLVLTKPSYRRLLVMDEPFKWLSRNYQPLIREMLEVLSKEFEIQIIFVTHSELLKCGKVLVLE